MQDRAKSAESLLGHTVFNEAMAELRQRYLDQVAGAPLGSPQLPILHVKIKVLDEVVGELRSIIADFKVRKSREQ